MRIGLGGHLGKMFIQGDLDLRDGSIKGVDGLQTWNFMELQDGGTVDATE